jgi:predicted transcriptional regulator
MDSRIGSFSSKKVICQDMEASVADVIKTLASTGLSALPVLDRGGRCFGIVTLKDIIQLIASGEDIRSLKAWEICSHTVIFVDPDITAIQACQVMRENSIHHLIIGNDAEEPVGIISTMDIVDDLHKTKIAEFEAYSAGN